MSKADLLKVVEAVEAEADYWAEDHSEAVTAAAFGRLAGRLAKIFDVPPCECGRYQICEEERGCPRSAVRGLFSDD